MKNYVITLARAYGSGGCEIGIKLAEQLGIKCYDKEILHLASDESGIHESFFYKADEVPGEPKALFQKKGSSSAPSYEAVQYVTNQELFEYQTKVICQLAMKESFVIIGRAADYVLRDLPNVVSVNIQAPLQSCIDTIAVRQQMTTKQAEKFVKKTNKTRMYYYNYYTGQDWRDPANYDICLNSARIGKDKCVDAIKTFVEQKLEIQL